MEKLTSFEPKEPSKTPTSNSKLQVRRKKSSMMNLECNGQWSIQKKKNARGSGTDPRTTHMSTQRSATLFKTKYYYDWWQT